MQLTAGRGPRECAYVVARLLGVLGEEAKAAGVMCSLVESETAAGPSPEAFLSATVLLEGAAAQSFAGRWLGTIQWVGTSPYRPKHKRKNWFVGITRSAAAHVKGHMGGKVQIETMRASGPGGQNLNKTNSAVRLTHVETGISVTARESRSQRQNRKLAHQKLQAQFLLVSETRTMAEGEQKWEEHQQVERGNPARVFQGAEFIEK